MWYKNTRIVYQIWCVVERVFNWNKFMRSLPPKVERCSITKIDERSYQLNWCEIAFMYQSIHNGNEVARGVVIFVVGNGWLEFKSLMRLFSFHVAQILLGNVWIQLFSFQLWVNSWAVWDSLNLLWQTV